MHFNKLDLNLLVAFDALCKECNITRAAERLHMSQSAMSHALRRLRTYFDDELLVQIGRKMEMTQRAQILHEAVREMLARLEVTLSSSTSFDPSQSDRTFTVFLSDYSMQVLWPRLLELAAQQHSRVRFRLQPQINHPDRPLDRGEADLMIIPNMYCSANHPVVNLFEEHLVCVVWAHSQLAQQPLTVEQYLRAGHIGMALPDFAEPAFEPPIAQRLGAGRRMEVLTYSFTAMPFLVVGTEYIATLQSRLVRSIQPALPIVVRDMPIDMPKYVQSMQWHKYRHEDAGLQWLRMLVQQAARSLDDE